MDHSYFFFYKLHPFSKSMDINRGMGDLFNEFVVIFILNFDF